MDNARKIETFCRTCVSTRSILAMAGAVQAQRQSHSRETRKPYRRALERGPRCSTGALPKLFLGAVVFPFT